MFYERKQSCIDILCLYFWWRLMINGFHHHADLSYKTCKKLKCPLWFLQNVPQLEWFCKCSSVSRIPAFCNSLIWNFVDAQHHWERNRQIKILVMVEHSMSRRDEGLKHITRTGQIIVMFQIQINHLLITNNAKNT